MLIGLLVTDIYAAARLPQIYSSNMVFQQKRPINIWGWADPDEKVSVKFGNENTSAVTDKNGEWKVHFGARNANSTPQKLTIIASNEIILDNILIGEVWLCSGQSNMSMPLLACENGAQIAAAADHPLLRIFYVYPKSSGKPERDIKKGTWKVCTPKTILEDGENHRGWNKWKGFSGVGYYFASELQQELNVPVGIVESAIGGSPIRSWLTEDVKLAGNNYKPGGPANTMIAPLAPLSFRGAIWYQGETNRIDGGRIYADKMEALIKGWRKIWPNLPFYFVQIAPYRYGNWNDEALAEFWEGQYLVTRKVQGTGIVSSIDVGNYKKIHPENKKPIGHRLVLQALSKTYNHRNIEADSPACKSIELENDKLKISFNHVPDSLKSIDGKPLKYFEILGAGEDKFIPAIAEINGKNVLISGVKNPVAVRYCWTKNIKAPNFYSSEGLPVFPFRAALPEYYRVFKALNADYP